MSLAWGLLAGTWDILADSSVYILAGLFFAGLVHVFLGSERLVKHLGGRDWKSVLKASLFGVPLPLCSCGVLPAAISIRRDGASSAATASFLVSTPESGVDSIAISFALLDPILTVVRPVAAFISAAAAGFGQLLFGRERESGGAGDDACCDACGAKSEGLSLSFVARAKEAFRYGFITFPGELAVWLTVGFILAGAIGLVPADWVAPFAGNTALSMVALLFLGIPMYVCATSSTPIAASLILQGFSPGSALVFLLVGPATNMASLTILVKELGLRWVALYLGAVVLSALLLGLALDGLYSLLGLDAAVTVGAAREFIPGWLGNIGGALLLLSLWGGWVVKKRREKAQGARDLPHRASA